MQGDVVLSPLLNAESTSRTRKAPAVFNVQIYGFTMHTGYGDRCSTTILKQTPRPMLV